MIWTLLKKEIRYYYPSFWTWMMTVVNEVAILTVIYFMAKAFVPDTNVFGGLTTDYFSFIFIGETCLRIPAILIGQMVKTVKHYGMENTLDQHLVMPVPFPALLLMVSGCMAIIEMAKILGLMLLAKIVFGLGLSIYHIFILLCIQLIAFPIFSGIGMIAAGVFLVFRRGEGVVAKITSIGAVLAGAYFPLNVLPEKVVGVVNIISPFNALLNICREFVSKSVLTNLNFTYFIGAGFLWLGIGMLVLKKSIEHYKKVNKPISYNP